MFVESYPLSDGVALARAVRAVASSARRTLKRPYEAIETQELLRAMDSLEQELETRQSPDLSNWLASLRSQVEHHGAVAVV